MSDVKIAILTPNSLAEAIEELINEGELTDAQSVADWIRSLDHEND